MKDHDLGFAAAECLGVVSLLAILIGYLWAMGSYWISGVGVFLMPISIIAYLLFTWLSQRRITKQGYWIMYAAKMVFLFGSFLLSPLISRLMEWLVNG